MRGTVAKRLRRLAFKLAEAAKDNGYAVPVRQIYKRLKRGR